MSLEEELIFLNVLWNVCELTKDDNYPALIFRLLSKSRKQGFLLIVKSGSTHSRHVRKRYTLK